MAVVWRCGCVYKALHSGWDCEDGVWGGKKWREPSLSQALKVSCTPSSQKADWTGDWLGPPSNWHHSVVVPLLGWAPYLSKNILTKKERKDIPVSFVTSLLFLVSMLGFFFFFQYSFLPKELALESLWGKLKAWVSLRPHQTKQSLQPRGEGSVSFPGSDSSTGIKKDFGHGSIIKNNLF